MRRHWTNRWAAWAATGVALIALAAPAARAAAPDSGNERAWLGVYSQELTEELRDGIDYAGRGVLVSRVVTDGPADRAGLRKGDIITSLNSRSVSTPSELASQVSDLNVGQSVSLGIVRDGAKRSLTVKLAARPDEDETPTPNMNGKDKDEDDESGEGESRGDRSETHTFQFKGLPEGLEMYGIGRGRLGVRVESLNPDLGGYFSVPDGHGVLVLEVLKGTPAERAGLRSGDVITRVGERAVQDADGLVEALGRENGAVSLTVIRRGARRTIEATLERSPRAMRWMGDGGGPMGLNDKDKVVIRRYGPGAGDESDMREQMRQLREELRQLREEMRKQQQHD